VAGVLGRPGAAGERDELRERETTPTHTTEITTPTQTHRQTENREARSRP